MTDDFRERMGRVEALVGVLEKCPDPAAREAARELVRALLDLHAAGLTRIIDMAGRASSLVERLADDDLVSSLLLLHGLHPHAAADRVSRALDRARPRLRAIGGDAELIEGCDDLVRLRVRGDLSMTLRTAVEEVVMGAAPDAAVAMVEVGDPHRGARTPLPLVARTGSRP